MATGTGKTFTTVNGTYRLMKSGVAKRVLFLVDRRALAAQAVRAFRSFEPEPGLKFDQIYELYRPLPPLLRRLREEAGLTQRDLGKKLDVSHMFVHKSEIGERRVDVAEFMDWCVACGADPEMAFLGSASSGGSRSRRRHSPRVAGMGPDARDFLR